MENSIPVHKLFVNYGQFKFIQLVKSNALLIKLLKKLEKTFAECFPDEQTSKFIRITEGDFTVPLLYKVGQVFNDKAEISVYGKDSALSIKTEKKVVTDKPFIPVETSKTESKKELVKREDLKREELKREELKREELKKEELKREELKREEKRKEDLRKEEDLKESKPEPLQRKKPRQERNRETPALNKFIKTDEDKKVIVQNENSKKELLVSASSEDSDSDIFTKDEKKPNLTKSNLFRN